MYKSKNHNKIYSISKIVLCLVTMLFFVSRSYSFDVVPLNFLSNWVDKVEKNMEINSAKWKAVMKDLYNESLEKAQMLEVNPMLEAVKKTTKTLNDNYLCNLKDDDLINILYIENSEFKKNIKNLSLGVSYPKRVDMADSCAKLMWCVLPSQDSRKIMDSLSYCSLVVNDYYLEQYNNSYNLSSLSKWNEWYEAYRNNSLEDSSYDILYDIYTLSKIFFDSPEEPTEVLFYDLPDISAAYESPVVEVDVEKDLYDPYYVATVRTWDSAWSGTSWSMSWNWTSSWNYFGVSWDFGDDFQEFVEIVTYNVEWKEGSEFLWNDCVDWFEIEWIEWYSYTGAITWYVSWETLAAPEYVNFLRDRIDSLSCNNNWRCEIWESSSCPDCVPWDWENPNPSWTGDNDDAQEAMTRTEKVKQCFSSCDNVPCTASSCDRLACYAKCVCISYASDLYNPLENVWLFSAFKLEICAVPVLDSKVVTTKKVNNLEMVINELYNVIWNLRNSGELQVNKKTKEFLDAWFQNNDPSKQLSFMIDTYNKTPEWKWSEKQEMDNQKELNTVMMETILWFETSQNPSGWARNKYVVKWWAIQEWTLIDTTKNNTWWYEEVGLSILESALQSEHLSDMDREVSEFLQSNLNFRFNIKDAFESLRDTAKTLANKK